MPVVSVKTSSFRLIDAQISEMRRLFETIRKLVERRYNADNAPENRDLQWQSVSAFCFLRFIVPAILHPHLFGLCPGEFWREPNNFDILMC